jgi:[acyl-carrier-protein] S-malonyltransferase
VTISYLVGGRVSLDAAATDEFQQRYPAVRRAYEQAAEWTGHSAAQLRTDALPEELEERQSIGALRQTALVVGIHDTLADAGIRPDAIGGVSLGGMTAACLAGAVGRREFFEMLHHQRLIPLLPPDAPAQAMATALIPADDDPAHYHGARRPGVFLAGEHGLVLGGSKRMLLLAGYRDALEAVAADVPPKTVTVLDGHKIAAHSPLRQHAADFMMPYIAKMTFRDPQIPLCSATHATTLTTADEVRELFIRNPVAPVGIRALVEELARHGTRIGVALGPAIPRGVLDFPFQAVHITKPEHLGELAAAVRDLDRTG